MLKIFIEAGTVMYLLLAWSILVFSLTYSGENIVLKTDFRCL